MDNIFFLYIFQQSMVITLNGPNGRIAAQLVAGVGRTVLNWVPLLRQWNAARILVVSKRANNM